MRTVLLTGGNSGIGLHAARALAAAGCRVVIASRDLAASERAASAHEGLVARSLDLGSIRDVDRFADAIEEFGPLDAIVCNAGLSFPRGLHRTVDGLEAQFAVNHLGHFRLVTRLLPSLAPNARVISVSSAAHRFTQDSRYLKAPRWPGAGALARPAQPDPDMDERRYATSKLCNALFADELARRIADGRIATAPGVTANVYEPGFVPGTELARGSRGMPAFLFRWVFPRMAPIWKAITPVDRSGRALAKLAIDGAYAGVTGRTFEVEREIEVPREVRDPARAAELWETSEALCRELVGSSTTSSVSVGR